MGTKVFFNFSLSLVILTKVRLDSVSVSLRKFLMVTVWLPAIQLAVSKAVFSSAQLRYLLHQNQLIG